LPHSTSRVFLDIFQAFQAPVMHVPSKVICFQDKMNEKVNGTWIGRHTPKVAVRDRLDANQPSYFPRIQSIVAKLIETR
jgi:hypothetical protein